MKLHGMLEGGEAVVSREDGTSFQHSVVFEGPRGDLPATARCFLECEEGKDFAIRFSRPLFWPTRDLSVRIHVDGRMIARRVVSQQFPSTVCTYITVRQSEGGIVTKSLRFHKLEVTDDQDSACQDIAVLKDLGNITLDFVEGVSELMPGVVSDPTVVSEIQAVHEKTKKGMIASTVGGGAFRPALPMPVSRFHPLRVPERVEYRIVFSYQTKEMLMARGIIDPPPQPAAKRVRHVSAPVVATGSAPASTIDASGRRRSSRIKDQREEIQVTEDVKPKIKPDLSQPASTKTGAGSSLKRPIDLTDD